MIVGPGSYTHLVGRGLLQGLVGGDPGAGDAWQQHLALVLGGTWQSRPTSVHGGAWQLRPLLVGGGA